MMNILDNIELPHPIFTYPDGTEGTLTESEYYSIVFNSEYDHEFRKEIDRLYNEMRIPFANTYAALLEEKYQQMYARAQILGYDTTMEMSYYKGLVDQYEELVAAKTK